MEKGKWKGLFSGWALILPISIFCFLFSTASLEAQSKKSKPADKREVLDVLISGGTVVTMDSQRRVIEDGALAVRGDSIVAIGPRTELERKYRATRRINAAGRIVMPGLINGHGHAPMTLLRGIADDVELHEWLVKYIFPAEGRNVNEEFVTWGTRLAALEMIRGGTTTFADMYYFEDSIARETKAAGMRGVLGETILGLPAPDNKTLEQALSYTEEFLKKWKGDPLIHAAIAPHSIYTCPEDVLRRTAALGRKYQAPILIHVAETKTELDNSLAKNGASPVRYLERIGVLGPDVLAAHCVWLDAEDIRILAERRVGCVHNPASNMKLASGTAKIPEMRAAGVLLGLGTDGPAGSNNDLNMFEEMDLAGKLAKVTRMDPAVLPAEQIVEMATIGGARALHMEKEIGSLEVGKKADLILIRIDAPNAVPMFNVYSHLVYALKANDVETVLINGKVVMEGRRVLTLKESEIVTKARELAEKVKKSLQAPAN
ncbi:MAG: amidohydrolase [Acidobacteria bacterium]|nr:amidohydrolase [Acidobacteriota bacterium]